MSKRRPGSDAAARLFKSDDAGAWLEAAASYDSCILAVSKKSKTTKQLVKDDHFFRNLLPKRLSDTGYLTHAELAQVTRWKLARGQWRPLQNMVESNAPAAVEKWTAAAAAELNGGGTTGSVEVASKHLCELRGIGPATASAIISAMVPDRAPFMADEAIESVPGLQREYTDKAYRIFSASMRKRAKELRQLDTALGDWTAESVGRSLWAEAKLMQGAGTRCAAAATAKAVAKKGKGSGPAATKAKVVPKKRKASVDAGPEEELQPQAEKQEQEEEGEVSKSKGKSNKQRTTQSKKAKA